MNKNTREKLFAIGLALCIFAVVSVFGREHLANAVTANLARVNVAKNVMVGGEKQDCPNITLAQAAPNFVTQNVPATTLGLYYYAVQDFVRAQEIWERVPAPNAADLFWRGCAAWRAGDKAGAIASWRAARAEMYFFNQGKAAYQERDISRALGLYEIGLQLAPDSKEGWDLLAQMQFERAAAGRIPWREALGVFERQVQLDPNDALTHYRIGYGLWASRGDWDRAETELRFAWARDKNWLIAYALGSLLVDRGKSAEAVGLLEYAFSNSDNAWTRFNLMRAYAEVGRCTDAESAKVQVLSKYPDIVNALRAWCRTGNACVCVLNP